MSQMNETSEYVAQHMHARIAGRKARLVADLIRGMPVNQAIDVLTYTPRRAARLFEKVLKSAMANASQHGDVDVNKLFVSECRVDDGPLLGGRPRWRPAARGRAMPIRKRTSHLRVKVAEEVDAILTGGPARGSATDESIEPGQKEPVGNKAEN